MLKGILALAFVAAAIALGVRYVVNEGTSQGPTTVRVEVESPLGGGDGGEGDPIYVP